MVKIINNKCLQYIILNTGKRSNQSAKYLRIFHHKITSIGQSRLKYQKISPKSNPYCSMKSLYTTGINITIHNKK